jgi:hypothetical protein
MAQSAIVAHRPTGTSASPVGPTPELRRLAEVVLDDAVGLSDAITVVLLEQEPSYREGEARVPEAELRDTIHADVQAVLRHLAYGEDLADEIVAQREIGDRRAEQGLPLESLLRAYHLGAQTTWRRIVDTALADPRADLGDLLRGGSYLFEVVDRLGTEVSRSYREAAAAIARRKAQRREVLFDALLDGRAADVTLAREAALALFLPAEGPYVVVVSEQPLRFESEPELVLRARGLASCWRLRGDRHVGIVATGHWSPGDVAMLLVEPAVGRTGVSPPGLYLGEIAELARLAELALATVAEGKGEVALFDENMVAALIASAPHVAQRLADRVLGPLLALEPPAPEVLLETLSTYIAVGGSVAEAAARLYCHRNTVLNRLRRIEGLTGMELSRPRDVATLLIVLEARRLATRAQGEG